MFCCTVVLVIGYVILPPTGMGWSRQNCICEEKQNPQRRFQVSTKTKHIQIIIGHILSALNGYVTSYRLKMVLSRSTAVEQLLERNYRIHWSVHNVVSTHLMTILTDVSAVCIFSHSGCGQVIRTIIKVSHYISSCFWNRKSQQTSAEPRRLSVLHEILFSEKRARSIDRRLHGVSGAGLFYLCMRYILF